MIGKINFRAAAMVSSMVAVSLLGLGAASGIAVEQDTETPIKIGFVTSLSVSSGADGPLMVKGMNLYLDQIQHKLAGHPVELIVENDESSPAAKICWPLSRKSS